MIKTKGVSISEEKKEEIFEIVVSSATELNKMIENLLEYSRTGTVQEDLEEVSTNDLIDGVIRQYEKDISALNGTISVDVTVNTILVYPILFKRLLGNLISNAIKYRGDNPPKIQVSGKVEGDYNVFSVKDNGMGIPENQFENIFKIFKSLKPNKDSNGIGLSVCKKIVELHSGEIWVESTPGEGSTFNFSIPKP